MSRLIRFPIASAILLVLWLVLNQTLSPGHILLGTAIALIGGWALAALELPKARPRSLTAVFRLATLVFADIVRSNIAVARIILGLERRRWNSGFVEIPLSFAVPGGLVEVWGSTSKF